MAVTFDITPEKEASLLSFVKRQLFGRMPTFTARDTDLSGKTAIVTGANTGLGLECARHLLGLGANLILAVRSEGRGEEARKDLLGSRGAGPAGTKAAEPTVEVWKLDLSSYDSVVAFTERAAALPRLDLAVLNAGLYQINEVFDPATGYEEGIQVNYLSNVLLLTRLLPVLKERRADASRPGRVVLVSSDMAAWSKFPERGRRPLLPHYKAREARWDMGERYGTTKLLGQLFVSELVRRGLRADDATVVLANPGLCDGTDLQRGLDRLSRFVFGLVQKVLARSAAAGSRVYVHAAAVLGPEAHGQYVEEGSLRPMAPIVYTAEGQKLAASLFDETLDELSSAGVKEIVAGLCK